MKMHDSKLSTTRTRLQEEGVRVFYWLKKMEKSTSLDACVVPSFLLILRARVRVAVSSSGVLVRTPVILISEPLWEILIPFCFSCLDRRILKFLKFMLRSRHSAC